ncbi:MAG: C25 family cysteine peptidase, partial [Chloroflexota bacterium]|nr:C25 family cysteine peptidase [Chloroflexota bacterium]
GFPDPMAIRRFLQHAVEGWSPAPRYILLVGDATYDPKGYKFPTEKHLLPTCFVNTDYGGQTSSDIPLAQLNDSAEDPWPDLAIGRVPASTAEQVRTFVEKTIAYEETPPASDWRKHIVAVADGQEDSFKTNAQTFLEHFPPLYRTTLVAPEAGNTSAAQEIQSELEEGTFLMAYFGHGSLRMWGKDQLFTTSNVAELNNEGHLPIILNFTCLTGFFTHPEVESLSESLLWNPKGGAVAVLAPSSLTLSINQNQLGDALAQALLSSHSPRLGDIVLQAWRQISTDSHDVMQTFMLFGDPALQISQLSLDTPE